MGYGAAVTLNFVVVVPGTIMTLAGTMICEESAETNKTEVMAGAGSAGRLIVTEHCPLVPGSRPIEPFGPAGPLQE